ncbi:MAG: hypothetical protein J7521_19255 [Caulobacter sp.]|nr:hypothetical protein [Caulobacter sp.]
MASSDAAGLGELERLSDPAARNALALALGEARDPGLPAVLVRLIQRPDLRDQRGTLVHVLGFYDCSEHVALLAELVAEGNFEVAHEAFEIADILDAIDDEDAQAAQAIIAKALTAKPADAWRVEMLRDLSDLLG